MNTPPILLGGTTYHMAWTIPQTYSPLEAFVYNRLIAGYMLDLHTHILEQCNLAEVLAVPKAQRMLAVDWVGRKAAFSRA